MLFARHTRHVSQGPEADHVVARSRQIVDAASIGVTSGFDLLIVRLWRVSGLSRIDSSVGCEHLASIIDSGSVLGVGGW